MQQKANPMASIYQTQLQASRRFADAVFSGTERLDRVVIEATHQAVNDQLNFVQSMASGSSLRDAGATLQSGMLQRNSDEAVNYQAEIIRIMAEMQSEIGKSMQECMMQMGSQAMAAPAQLNQAAQTAQSQASAASDNPVTSMFSVWESAFNEVTALATRSMTAARANVERATETASNLTRNAARTAESTTGSAIHATRRAADEASDRKGGRSK